MLIFLLFVLIINLDHCFCIAEIFGGILKISKNELNRVPLISLVIGGFFTTLNQFPERFLSSTGTIFAGQVVAIGSRRACLPQALLQFSFRRLSVFTHVSASRVLTAVLILRRFVSTLAKKSVGGGQGAALLILHSFRSSTVGLHAEYRQCEPPSGRGVLASFACSRGELAENFNGGLECEGSDGGRKRLRI